MSLRVTKEFEYDQGERSPLLISGWNKRTTLEKRLIIFSALAFIALIVISVFLGIAVHKNKEKHSASTTTTATTTKVVTKTSAGTTPKPHNVCETTICHQIAQDIKFAMDQSTEPCDDFYQFACGNYLETEHIEPFSERVSVLDGVRLSIDDKLLEIFEKEDTKNYSRAMESAITLYKQCLDTDKMNEQGIEPLQDLFFELTGTSWPIANATWSDDDVDISDIIPNLIKSGIPALMNVEVGIDWRNASKYTLQITGLSRDQFGLDIMTLLNMTRNEEVERRVEAYKTLIGGAAKIMSGTSEPVNETLLEQDVQDIVDLEYFILKNLVGHSENLYKEHSIEIGEFEQFLEEPGVILDILRKVAPKASLTEHTKAYVLSKDYFKGIVNSWQNISTRAWINYLGWNIVRSNGLNTVDKYREINLEFQSVISNVSASSPRNMTCISEVNQVYGFATVGEYAKHYFPDSARKEVKMMMDDIVEAFEQKLTNTEWMDDVTKARALQKARLVVEFIAYPDWTLRNSIVDSFYFELIDGISANSTYLDNMNYHEKFFKMVNVGLLMKTPNRTSWDTIGALTPLTTNAYYDPTRNSIHILAGILDGSAYKQGRPAAINYGSIGMVLGHELTHGFDNQGRHYNEYGSISEWWENKTLAIYEEKTKCFVEQYGQIYDAQAHLNISGNLTLGENIADNGGIRRAFTAYEKYVNETGKNDKLPGLDQFSPEQLFFLSFGHLWCGKQRSAALRNQILYNPHSPAKYRVNVVVENFEVFSKAYNCKVGTKMHPEHRCAVW